MRTALKQLILSSAGQADTFEYEVPDPEGSVDSDYQALLTEGAGFTLPTESEQTTSNLFFKWIKYVGALSRAYVFYLFIKTGDDEFSRLNVKSPGDFTLSPVNSPTLTDDGRAGNNSNAYDNTQWNARAQSVINNYVTYVELCNTADAQDKLLAGAQTPTNERFTSQPRGTTGTASLRLFSGTNIDFTSITDARGVRQYNRFGNIVRGYKNGVCLFRGTNTVVNTPNANVYFHAENNNGTPQLQGDRRLGAAGFFTKLEIPMNDPLVALRDGDDSFFTDFFLRAQKIREVTSVTMQNSTGLNGFDSVYQVPGTNDFIAGSTSGTIYYFTYSSINSWTRTTLVTTGDDIENVLVFRDPNDDRLIIISTHDATSEIRIHKADTSNDKGAYTTVALSSSTFPNLKSSILHTWSGDTYPSIIFAWQGSSTANGGIGQARFTGSDIMDSGDWTIANKIHMANLWHIKGFLSNGKILASGRNYPERFLGGDGPGIHLITADGPTDTWTFETIYNAVFTDPAINRILDHLASEPGNFLGNGNEDIINVNYDTGGIIILDAGNSYAATILDPGISTQATRVFPLEFSRNGRQCFVVVYEDSFAYLFSWDGSQFCWQQLWATGRHPEDGQYCYEDIDGDGIKELIIPDGSLTYAGVASGRIKIIKFEAL